MIPYNPNFLENINIFTKEELKKLNELNQKVSLSHFLSNKSYIEKFGMDFIHTSAKIEGNTYDKHDTYTLLEYGRTAGGKKYSDAKMILNMKLAYDTFIREDLEVSKEILKLATKEKLDDELNYMLKKYKTIDEPFNRALYIHCNLAYLQYFKDCNKRTARMMLNISLKSDDMMLYIPNEEKIGEYLRAVVEYFMRRVLIIGLNAILSVEDSRRREASMPLRGE